MPKPHPRFVPLKHNRCPDCREPFRDELRALGREVHVVCRNNSCGYSVELYFLESMIKQVN